MKEQLERQGNRPFFSLNTKRIPFLVKKEQRIVTENAPYSLYNQKHKRTSSHLLAGSVNMFDVK